MASDNERRKVARRLRGIDINDVLFDSELVDVIEYACGSKRKRRDFVKIIDRLADLIEPSPSCEFWDSEEKECYSVHTVRTCRIAEEVDEVETELGPIEVRTYLCGECHGRMMPDDAYCPNCGAKVVGE